MAEFDVENLSKQKPGSTVEKTLGVTGKSGVYKHPGSGQEAIAIWDPITGNTQAEALTRVGFEWVRDVREGDITTMVEASIAAENQKKLINSNEDEIKGIMARLNAVESENAKLKEEKQAEATPTSASQDHAKDAAVEQTKQREEVNLVPEDSGVNAPINPHVPSEDKDNKPTNKKGQK